MIIQTFVTFNQQAADIEEEMGAKISEFERVTEELQCLQVGGVRG